jgi:hypothetical protein
MLCIGHSAPRTGQVGCLLLVLTCAQARRQITLWTVTDEPPGSQTASSRTTVMAQSWRTERLFGHNACV